MQGGSQHDAQEFLLWLLDRVHEELNTATKKKYKRLKDLPGRPDDVVAAESLANYMRCNNSFVMDNSTFSLMMDRPGNSRRGARGVSSDRSDRSARRSMCSRLT